MHDAKMGELTVRIAGGTDREGGGDGPVVVLLHGFGAPGDDLVGLYRVLDVPAEIRFVFPHAPLSLPEAGGGRAWWMVDVEALERALAGDGHRDMSATNPVGLDLARDQVNGFLDDLEAQLGVTGEQIILGGFSQGAMLSLDVALRSDRPLSGMVLMSGTLLAKDIWVPKMPARSGMPALLSHGERDPLLSWDQATVLRDELKSAGWDVTWVGHRGGHEIPGSVTNALGSFVRRHLTEAHVRSVIGGR